jgi:hypothetical protein
MCSFETSLNIYQSEKRHILEIHLHFSVISTFVWRPPIPNFVEIRPVASYAKYLDEKYETSFHLLIGSMHVFRTV